MHYESLTIQHFRGFDHLELTGFRRINLITGTNNIGKTTVLEALFMHAGANDYRLPLIVNSLRDMTKHLSEPEQIWGWLFHGKDTGTPIQLSSHFSSPELERTLTLSLVTIPNPWALIPGYTPEQVQQAKFPEQIMGLQMLLSDNGIEVDRSESVVAANGHVFGKARPPQLTVPQIMLMTDRLGTTEDDIRNFSKLEVSNRLRLIQEPMSIIEPRLKRMALANLGEQQIFVDIGLAEMVPITMLGSGTRRLLSMILNLLSKPGGVVLIDEIGQGLHHSILTKVWGALYAAAKLADVQIFATTHSKECIDALIDNDAIPKQEVTGYGLLRKEGSVSHQRYTGEELQRLHALIDFDLRGGGP